MWVRDLAVREKSSEEDLRQHSTSGKPVACKRSLTNALTLIARVVMANRPDGRREPTKRNP